uniref:Uncharacterized protein n=1 Tax=Panagrolaimus sp. ES5 TaxID=591445 RepID=A0AC34G3B3_9BILA
MIAGRPVGGYSSGMPDDGTSNDDLINGASTYSLAQEQNLNNAPAFEKIRENESLADTVSPRELTEIGSGRPREDAETPAKLTDLGIGLTSERLAVLPPSNFQG